MQSLQEEADRSLAEAEAIRAHFLRHRTVCDKTREQEREALDLLAKDVPLARVLIGNVTIGCDSQGGSPPEVVQCSLPDNSFVTTFKDQKTRDMAIRLSNVAERFVAVQLDRAVRGNDGTPFDHIS